MQESQDHLRAKERIRDIVRSEGYIAEEEYEILCWSPYHNKAIFYACDVLILRKGYTQVVEIDGYKGHSSKFQSGRDRRRTDDMQRAWFNPIRVQRYTLEELRICTDTELSNDLGF